MRWGGLASWILTAVNVAIAGCFVWAAWSKGWEWDAKWDSVQTVTIVLAALGVMLTALGIFIAALAIWGYTHLRDEAGKSAREEVGLRIPELVQKEVQRMLGKNGDYGAAASTEGNTDAGPEQG